MIYKTKGTCSTQIDIEVENGIIKQVAFTNGCNGNLQGVSRLVEGMKAEDAIAKAHVFVYLVIYLQKRLTAIVGKRCSICCPSNNFLLFSVGNTVNFQLIVKFHGGIPNDLLPGLNKLIHQ